MTPASVKTFADVQALRLSDIGASMHVIAGPNGACLCGIYDGQALTCQKIIAMTLYGKTDGTIPLPAGTKGPLTTLRIKDLVAAFPVPS